MWFDFSPLFAAFFAVEWGIRVLMLFVVPKKERAATINAWLLLIVISPMFGTLVYYMFGNPNLPKSRREKLRAVNILTDKELSEIKLVNKKLFAHLEDDRYQSISRLATHLGGLPPMHGSQIDFMSDYETIFEAIAHAIDQAEDYVHVQYYIATYDGATRPVFDALRRATQRGVKIRFLYDRLLSGRFKGKKAMRDCLKDMGAYVRPLLPLRLVPGRSFTRPDLRNHRKLVIVDGHTAFTGSQNLIDRTYGYGGNKLVYEELVARLTGPVVWQLNNIFRADWYSETDEPLLDVVEDRDMPEYTGSVIAQVLPSGPNHEHDNNLKLYTALIHSAQKSVSIVVPYFIPDDSLLDAITTAAQRGVSVSIMNSEVIDKVLAGHAQRSYYEKLLEAGVDIYLRKAPVFLHAKQLVVDDEVVIFGSSNLDMRSFELDFELNTIVYDHAMAKKMVEIESYYREYSMKLSLDTWNNRPLRFKLLDRFARLAAAFL